MCRECPCLSVFLRSSAFSKIHSAYHAYNLVSVQFVTMLGSSNDGMEAALAVGAFALTPDAARLDRTALAAVSRGGSVKKSKKGSEGGTALDMQCPPCGDYELEPPHVNTGKVCPCCLEADTSPDPADPSTTRVWGDGKRDKAGRNQKNPCWYCLKTFCARYKGKIPGKYETFGLWVDAMGTDKRLCDTVKGLVQELIVVAQDMGGAMAQKLRMDWVAAVKKVELVLETRGRYEVTEIAENMVPIEEYKGDWVKDGRVCIEDGGQKYVLVPVEGVQADQAVQN